MAMILNEEQNMLRDSARDFVRDKAPVSTLRKIRDEANPDGYDKALWKEMADLGWAGVTIPEEFGGAEFGFQGLGVVLEETGRTLVPSPLMSTVVLGASALLLGGTDEHKSTLLSSVALGDCLLALASEEGAHHTPHGVATTATADGDGWLINGNKTQVLDGHVANHLIVSARTAGSAGDRDGISLFLIEAGSDGVSIDALTMVDSRNSSNVTLNNVRVGADAFLGSKDQGADILDAVLDRGCIALAAEMLGAAQQVFEFTLEYLKERHQFGQAIGTFQALQHRAVKMFGELEICKSVVMEALTAVDDNRDDIPVLASFAKAKLGDALHLISSEGVQMHGGIGMTDEHDSGLYLKRARVAEHTFGSTAWHRDRFATLSGY
jgi:alkylation response protein AidB-like acyl-CoA dehydrogenase